MNQPRRLKRTFIPDQKANIVRQIETDMSQGSTLAAAILRADIQPSSYRKWKRQLEVGIHSSLRNGKAPIDRERKALEKRIAKLETIVLEQAALIADLKKETNWD